MVFLVDKRFQARSSFQTCDEGEIFSKRRAMVMTDILQYFSRSTPIIGHISEHFY